MRISDWSSDVCSSDLGTVWGIMRSFTAIAGAQNTSLAVVAPGIAEALFATAIGLFAAIPAVIGYNRLLHGVGRLETRLNAFSDEFRSEEHTSELQSLMRISYAVFCLKKKKHSNINDQYRLL